jgi:hypothetical protein
MIGSFRGIDQGGMKNGEEWKGRGRHHEFELCKYPLYTNKHGMGMEMGMGN